MAFFQIQSFSGVLNVATTVNVIMPEANQGIGLLTSAQNELPKVLYLLHGYSDDHSIWMRRTSVERYAASHNLAVIMPAVNHSFYCNEKYGERYWDYISEELPQTMSRFLKISTKREDTFVAGLSMGGYGAMRLALTYPERFAAAGSFSGAVDIVEEIRYLSEEHKENWKRVLGDLDHLKGTEIDNMYMLVQNRNAVHKPRIYVSCGTADFLYPQHFPFVNALQDNGWEVTHYEKPEATHEWGFWDEQIKAFIEFIYT